MTKTTTNMSEYMTVKEALSALRIGRTKLYELFESKSLTKYKFDGRTMIHKDECKNLVRICS